MAERDDVPLCPDCTSTFCDFRKWGGVGAKPPSLGYILLCLDKVSKVGLG